jgi:hypothetical protein
MGTPIGDEHKILSENNGERADLVRFIDSRSICRDEWFWRESVPGRWIRMNGRNSATLNTSLRYLMTFAYGIPAQRILEGPDSATAG